ncbi:unnamed protein product [Closterium sp. Naga37s-1]|nr:unnamed protein product [Closterium sp. Naga37s-1]
MSLFQPSSFLIPSLPPCLSDSSPPSALPPYLSSSFPPVLPTFLPFFLLISPVLPSRLPPFSPLIFHRASFSSPLFLLCHPLTCSLTHFLSCSLLISSCSLVSSPYALPPFSSPHALSSHLLTLSLPSHLLMLPFSSPHALPPFSSPHAPLLISSRSPSLLISSCSPSHLLTLSLPSHLLMLLFSSPHALPPFSSPHAPRLVSSSSLVSWHEMNMLQRATEMGEALVLPITVRQLEAILSSGHGGARHRGASSLPPRDTRRCPVGRGGRRSADRGAAARGAAGGGRCAVLRGHRGGSCGNGEAAAG